MPRLYREAPLMGIWEGSGNVSALDTLRAMATRPECVDVLFDELARTAGRTRDWMPTSRRCKPALGDLDTIQYRARKVAEDIAWRCRARCWCATDIPPSPRRSSLRRLGGQWGGAFGTLPTGLDLAPILERVLVKG